MTQTQGKFISLLKQEISVLEDLYVLLKKELDALKQRDVDLISTIAEEKNNKLNHLGMLDKQRQLYFEDEKHFIDASQEDQAFIDKINSLRDEVENHLAKCKQQNSINGGAIEISQLFNAKILDIICGNTEDENTYSAKGKNTSNNNLHSLARV